MISKKELQYWEKAGSTDANNHVYCPPTIPPCFEKTVRNIAEHEEKYQAYKSAHKKAN